MGRTPPYRLSVLVVDDLADTAQSTAELLALYGYAVRVAAGSEEALRAAAAASPDVVLLDIGLAGMDGWELTRRLRDRAVGKQPIVVAVSGYGQEADRRRSAEAGVDLHLVKPVEPGVLVGVLER